MNQNYFNFGAVRRLGFSAVGSLTRRKAKLNPLPFIRGAIIMGALVGCLSGCRIGEARVNKQSHKKVESVAKAKEKLRRIPRRSDSGAGARSITSPLQNDFSNGQTPVINLVSGDNQQGAPGGFLSKPLIVSVSNRTGAALIDAPVTFTVTSGGGTLQKTNITPAATALALAADSEGRVKAFFKLPASTSAAIHITVTSGKGSHVAKQVFTASIDTSGTTYKDPFDPSDMVATLNPDGSVDASWTNNTDPADTEPINVRFRGPNGTWITAITVPAGTTSAHIPAQ